MASVAVAALMEGGSKSNVVIDNAVADTATIASLLAAKPSAVLVVYSDRSARNFQSLQATLGKIEARLRQGPWQPPAGT